jgi:hypothetical protein
MLETAEELGNLQRLLDHSMAGAGEHLRGIITGERRLWLGERLRWFLFARTPRP